MKEFTTAGPMDPRRIHVEVNADSNLLKAVDAFIAVVDSKEDSPTDEYERTLDQAYEALVLAADVARGNA